MDNATIITIVTSAAVGAVVSAAISGGTQALTAWRERVARKRELAFKHAFELARGRTEMMLRIAKEQGRSATIKDDAFQAAGYYRWFLHLFDKGDLPPDAWQTESGKIEKASREARESAASDEPKKKT